MAVIVRSNMCRGFPQAVRMDYSGLDVGGGLVGRAAGRGPAAIATTLRNAPGPACVMRAQRDGIHTTLRHASSARRNPPQLDPCRPTSHNASPADITKTTPRGRGHRGRQPRAGPPGWRRPPGGGAHRHALPAPAGHGPTPPRRGSPTDGAPDPGPRPDSPGADAQTDGATGTTDTTGPGLAPAARPRRPPLVGDGAGKPSFGAFPRLSARSYRGCHQLNGPNREKISVNRAPRPAPAHRAPAQRGVR